jgi:hypothetical protein
MIASSSSGRTVLAQYPIRPQQRAHTGISPSRPMLALKDLYDSEFHNSVIVEVLTLPTT